MAERLAQMQRDLEELARKIEEFRKLVEKTAP